ncbi:MAG: ATP-dependent Clp protease adaptor ClpS [Fimbriimonadaceae bacterium]
MGRLTFSSPVESPIRFEEELTSISHWIVTVYNNDHNTYDQVIGILMLATQCDYEEAAIETWEVDHLGKSVVHVADEAECHQVAKIIGTIGIRVEVSQE